MSMFGKIRRMYFRDKLSVCEIARRTSLSRNTIKKWLACDGGREPQIPEGACADQADAVRGPAQAVA